METVDRLNYHKYHKSNQQEVNDALNKIAVVYSRFRNIPTSGGNDIFQTGKVNTAKNTADGWHDNIVDKGSNDCRKGAADDNANGQVYDAAAGNKLLKLGNKTLCFFHSAPLYLYSVLLMRSISACQH